jgi:hypothetical protein
MATWNCESCGKSFNRRRSGDRRIRFCSQPCYHAWRGAEGITTGQFEKGIKPWNKGKKGIHLSPSTEFKKGQASLSKCPLGTVSVRESKRDGKKRAYVKVADPKSWRMRCHVVYEQSLGPIPKGKLVHHKDGDTLNDTPENLIAISRAEHLATHRPEIEAKRIINAIAARRGEK